VRYTFRAIEREPALICRSFCVSELTYYRMNGTRAFVFFLDSGDSSGNSRAMSLSSAPIAFANISVFLNEVPVHLQDVEIPDPEVFGCYHFR
jgi:hypothetical protein